jgi:hypothetical protein
VRWLNEKVDKVARRNGVETTDRNHKKDNVQSDGTDNSSLLDLNLLSFVRDFPFEAERLTNIPCGLNLRSGSAGVLPCLAARGPL